MSSDSAVTPLDEAALVSDGLDVGFSFPVGPGPVLLGGLVSTDVQTVDEAGLVDMVAGLRRCAAFVDAMTARVVAELAARRGGLTPPAETEEELLDADQCAVVESRVLADGRAVTPGQFPEPGRAAGTRAVRSRPRAVEPQRSLWAERSAEGGVELHASLTADGGHVVATCLDALATPTGPDDDRPVATRRADALVELCRWRLDAGDLPPTPSGARPHLALLATPNDLCESTFAPIGLRTPGLGESAVSPGTARRLTCDAGIASASVDAAGRVTALGRETRFPTAALRRRLELRDGTCRFPGCTRHASRCHAHHVVHWADGGPTTEEDMILTCARHDHAVHEGGWHVHLDGADVRWTDPHGRGYHHPPPLAEPPRVDHPDDLVFVQPYRLPRPSARRPAAQPSPPPSSTTVDRGVPPF